MNKVTLSIGSNLGDREDNLSKAIKLIEENGEKVIQKSPIYETEPVGYQEQGEFLNQALEIESKKEIKELIQDFQEIEKKLKKDKKVENGPRTIDIDILYYNSEIINEANLNVPHPRMHERLFVLKPLNDIQPNFKHPVLLKTTSELLKDLKSNNQVKPWISKK